MLRFDHVSLSYGSQKILNDLCFEIEEGQFAVLIGPSGCGKTTTLKMINRLIQPDTGKIYLNEEDITSKDKVELRRHIGYVIQQIGLSWSRMFLPSMRIDPVSGSSRRLIIFMVVVLPQPDGPMSTTN